MKREVMYPIVPLGSLLEVPPQNGYSPICDSEPTGKWLLSLSALTENGLDLSQVKPAPLEDPLVDKFMVNRGDFLISRSNTLDKVGRIGLYRGGLENLSYPDLMMRFRASIHKVFPDYLEIYLRSDEASKHIQQRAVGTSGSMKKISREVVERIPILLPPLDVQREIASAIRTWHLAVEVSSRLIVAKNKQCEWLKRQLLTGLIRVRNYSGRWQQLKLSEILTEHAELSSGREDVFSVSVHKGLVNQVEHLGRTFAAQDTSNYNLVKPGDIVYTKSPTGDFPYGIAKQSRVDSPVIVSPLYGVFTPKTCQLGAFLDFYFESPTRAKNYLKPIIQKGAKNTINITNQTFLSNSLYLPAEDQEVEAIVELLNAARLEIDLLKKRQEAYQKQKRGLMQKLLTGEWRVKTDESETTNENESNMGEL